MIESNVVATAPKTKRARKELMTPRLATVLDKCKISERDTTHLLHAFLEAVNLDPSEYVINRTSCRKQRNVQREMIASSSKSVFLGSCPKGLTLHWDGKKFADNSGKFVERISVLVTGTNIEQLLGVPELPSGCGSDIKEAVSDLVDEWALKDYIEAFSFDTTSTNTGRNRGLVFY